MAALGGALPLRNSAYISSGRCGAQLAVSMEVAMRKIVQAVILIVGFGVAIAEVNAERGNRTVANCFEMTAPSNPSVCN